MITGSRRAIHLINAGCALVVVNLMIIALDATLLASGVWRTPVSALVLLWTLLINVVMWCIAYLYATTDDEEG